MNTPTTQPTWTLIVSVVMALASVAMLGCKSSSAPISETRDSGDAVLFNKEAAGKAKLTRDREAILAMAGTYRVTFAFEETLALRDGYEIKKPYNTAAEELVVVVQSDSRFISLQHLLVVRHDGETHVINHWRQDWAYQGQWGHRFAGENTWEPATYSRDESRGSWVQSVYNVADSPRYSSIGRWTHRNGVSSWTGSPIRRPLPLREFVLKDQYTFLDSVNTLLVTNKGWVHDQQNQKLDPDHANQPVLALEHGSNRYTRIPDKGFEKAHEYWKNTAPYWAQVRAVWAKEFAKQEPITLAKQWKGDSLFTHLFGLADDNWGVEDASEARPSIEKVIKAFLLTD